MSDIEWFRRMPRERLLSTRGDLESTWDVVDMCTRRFMVTHTQDALDEWREVIEEAEADLDDAGPLDRARCVARRVLLDACQAWFDSGERTPPGEFLEMALMGHALVGTASPDCMAIGPVLAGLLLDLAWPLPLKSSDRPD